MKNKRTFLSAKVRKTPKSTIQKEFIENNNHNSNKKKKYNNLSLNINISNKERKYGLSSKKNKHYNNSSSKFIRSFSTTNNISSLSKKKKISYLSTKNLFSNIFGSPKKSSYFPTVITHRGLIKSPSAVNSYIYSSRFFKIEDEKLAQQIYYLKNNISKMNKNLILLGNENFEKDKILTEKENEINFIINKNNNKSHDNINEMLSRDKKNYLINKENNQDINSYYMNNLNLNIIFNDITLNNYNYNNLFTRIRFQIIKNLKEIEETEEEIIKNRKSIFFTKMNEIDIISALYKQQINKFNILINNAASIYERNKIKIKEYEALEKKLKSQQKVLNCLNKEYSNIKKEELLLNKKIKKMKNIIFLKNNKKFKNINLINDLNKKNDILSKDKYILLQIDNKNMIKKLKHLKKNVELFKFYYNHTSNEINKLKKNRENILSNKKLKINSDLYSKEKNMELKYQIFNYPKKIDLNKKIEELSLEYDKKKYYENLLKKEYEKYESKFNQMMNTFNEESDIKNSNINNNYDDIYNNNNTKKEDLNNQSDNNRDNKEDLDKTIKNEINEDNPYFSSEDSNIPEKTNRFNKIQFKTFEYILFKNFESKNILLNESQNKIIEPFTNIISQKNIKDIKYNSDSFYIIINELTKIIMNALKNINQKNQKLISIFIGSIIHISNYNINKLIEYINLLFSYTTNYSLDEEKYIYKLQTKYKDQLILLYNKLYEYINNNLYTKSSYYIPLLKMKEIIEENNIQLKEKYSAFLYYYMKKFNDPNSNLDDLDFDLLNNFFLDNTNSNENDSVTEITNEEYEKQLKEAIDIIKKGLNQLDLSFGNLVKDITYKAEIDDVFYDYFTIENFNEELKKNKIILTELKLSCLCNKYCLPENLKFIDKNKIENDILK